MTAPTSRLHIDPTTLLPTVSSAGELNQFLRDTTRSADSAGVGAGMTLLAGHAEQIVQALRATRARAEVAPLLVDFLTVLREHRAMVVSLGTDWRTLYEYPAYLAALNNFRLLVGQWLGNDGASGDDLPDGVADFEMVAWRTLGEGMLLIDMYEQWRGKAPPPDSVQEAQGTGRLERALQWWSKLRL